MGTQHRDTGLRLEELSNSGVRTGQMEGKVFSRNCLEGAQTICN